MMLRPDDPDDIWHAYNIIQIGDEVFQLRDDLKEILLIILTTIFLGSYLYDPARSAVRPQRDHREPKDQAEHEDQGDQG
jgi:hypothetical protein